MRDAIEWIESRVVDGVVERSFRFTGVASAVPGMLWLPSAPASAPSLVLLGHGGSGHKASARIVDLARWFATQTGLAALAIDGPYHGDRVPRPLAPAEYQAHIAAEGIGTVLDRMADEWRATVAALGASGLVDSGSLAYLGMSMGTRFGLPFAAAIGDKLRCAVFGKFGLRQSPAMHRGLDAPDRIMRDARRVSVPVLFHIQWHDEIFPRDGQLALFDLLSSKDKQLITYSGPHTETKPEAVNRWRDFISRHLVSSTHRARWSRRYP